MSNDDNGGKVKSNELPLMKYLRNQTISTEVTMENIDKIYDMVMQHVNRKEDVTEPLVSIYTFLFYYAKRAIDPKSGYNMSRQNMIDIYTAFHETLIKDIQKYDFKSSLSSSTTYDFSSPSPMVDTTVNEDEDEDYDDSK